MFFLRIVSNPGLMFFCWIVSNPGHGTRIARGLGWYNYWLCLLSLLADIPLLGAARIILVMAPELQEDLLGTKVKKVLLSLIQNKELGATRDVTAPELQEVSLYQFI